MKSIEKNIPIKAIIMAFEASYDGLHILDKKGNTLYINDACTRIEGTSKEEVKRKNIRELVKDGVYSQSVTLQVLEKKESVTITQTTKNGNEILSTGTPVFDETGDVEFVIVNARDVTALNKLKNKLSLSEYQLEKLKLEQKRFSGVVVNSAVMQKIMGTALHIAKVDSTVLLTGESGVGKGVFARFIHEYSMRREGPFVKVDCSSIPESLFESELFGYEKGAFTGANQEGKIGLLEMANGGTVFLDEIGDMPIGMQAKLMRAIQDLEILPVGGHTTRKIDVRFISATNVDLLKAIENKTFRADLFYRLNVVPIHIPPLRDRMDDIPPLINMIVDKINNKYGFDKTISVEAFDSLMKYEWPGNVRQLENTIERILVSNRDDVIKKSDLSADILGTSGDIEQEIDIYHNDYRELLADYDKKILEIAILNEGSIPKAAKILGIDATTIRRKLEKYNKKA